jgi:hypothetical protein
MKLPFLPWILALGITALVAPHSAADSLDELILREQRNVDNESVLVYGGNVGKLDAVFFIEWAGTGKPIVGYYFYPSKGRKKIYTLKGNNPKEGILNLVEYTPDDSGKAILTANCRLTKRVTADRILWEGTMNNTDGRQLPMKFSRPR